MQVIEFKTKQGVSVMVERVGEAETIAGGPSKILAQVSFDDALQRVQGIASSVAATLPNLPGSPQEVSVEFGLQLQAEAGVVLARGSATGHLTIKLLWRKPA